MTVIGRVQGTAAQAVPLIVGKTTVYVHENIEEVETEEGTIWEYDETIYPKDEYIELMANENAQLRETVTTMSDELTSTQLALVDVYEMIGGEG